MGPGVRTRGLSSDLYGLSTKRDQGERGLPRDSHLNPSQTNAPKWPQGPHNSVEGQDEGFALTLHELEHHGRLEV